MEEKVLMRTGECFDVVYRWNAASKKEFYLLNITKGEILPEKYSSKEDAIKAAVDVLGCIYDELPF